MLSVNYRLPFVRVDLLFLESYFCNSSVTILRRVSYLKHAPFCMYIIDRGCFGLARILIF